METFCRITIQPPLFELKLKTFPLLHRCEHFVFTRRLNEICKTLRRKNAAKFRMHFIGSLIKLNRISEVSMHGRFFESFIKSWKISLVTYKNM